MDKGKLWIELLIGLGVIISGCTLTINASDIAASVEVLETQVSQQEDWLSSNATQISYQSTRVAQQEEWISYQATQVMAHQGMIMYLATGAPEGEEGRYGFPQDGTLTPTPYIPLRGSVSIHQGGCCVGSQAGSTIEVDVQFEAFSDNGDVVEMRVLAGPPLQDEDQMDDLPWEPFRPEKLYPVYVATNWTSFWVHVQFRDETGMLSPVYSDEIGVEGH